MDTPFLCKSTHRKDSQCAREAGNDGLTKKPSHQAMALLLRCSGDGVAINSMKIDIRVPVLSVRYERYPLCALRGIVSALQGYSASAIII